MVNLAPDGVNIVMFNFLSIGLVDRGVHMGRMQSPTGWGKVVGLLSVLGLLGAMSAPAEARTMASTDSMTGVALTVQEWMAQIDSNRDQLNNPNQPVEPLEMDPSTPLNGEQPGAQTEQPETPPAPATDNSPPEATPTPTPAEALPEQVEVQTLEVVGSTVFSPADFQSVLAPYENRTLSLEELQQAADAVTQLYLNAGYITSRAILPNQTVTNGNVQIQVIEGELEEIQVEGSDRLANYVRRRVALGGTKPVNQARLEDQLRLLRADPLFDNVEASLRAGTGVGQSILIVRVTEADPFIGNLSFDTLSPRSVGQYRLGATLQYLNLAGLGDTLTAAAYRTTTSGSQIYELSYEFPVNAMDGTVLLRLAPNSFRITDPREPTFNLGLRGSTDIYEVIYRQPLIRTPREELALSAGFRYRNGNSLIAGFVTPPTITSVFSFSQDYLRRDLSGAWAFRSQFRLGTGLFDATSRPDPQADGQFFSWLGQVQRVQVLNPDNLLVIQGDVQLSPDALLGSEQFFIGGQQSVRGYFQNARFGDNGLRLSVEDRITLVRDEGDNPIAQVSPFLDLGYVWASGGNRQVTDQNFLMGTGAGFIFNPAEGLTARVDLGIPLISANQLVSDQPEGLRVYFNANYRF